MTTRSYNFDYSPLWPLTTVDRQRIRKYLLATGADSPRVNGVLQMRENNFSLDFIDAKKGYYHIFNPYNGIHRFLGPDLGGNTSVGLNPPGGNLDTTLVNKLLAEWRSTEFNLGVFLAEGKESAKMVTARLLGLVSAWRALRRLDLGGCLRHLTGQPTRVHRRRASQRLGAGDVSGAFLELNLGWRPMIQDVYEASNLLRFGFQPERNLINVVAGWSIPATSTLSSIYVKYFNWRGGQRWIAKMQHTTPSFPERLGLTNPAQVAWELVPLSFVVDWFIPIGDTLEAIHGIRVLPVSTITKVSYTKLEHWARHTDAYMQSAYPPTQKLEKVFSYGRSTVVRRVVDQSLPSGYSLLAGAAKKATVSPKGSLQRLETAFMLFTQKFGR